MSKAEPKISTSEVVLIGLFLAILDTIDLIPFAGDLTDVAAAPLVLYYFLKHINGIAYVVAEILDAIPLTQEFPTRSLVWLGTVIFDRFAPDKVEEAVEKIGEAGEGGEGGGGLEGEEGLANASSEGAQSAASAEGAQIEGAEGVANEEAMAEGGQAAEGGEREAGGGNETAGEEKEGRTTEEQKSEGRSENGENGEEGEGGEGGQGEEGEEGDDLMATESEKSWEQETAGDLFGPDKDIDYSPKADEEDEESNGAAEEAPSNLTSIDSSKKWQGAQNYDVDNALPGQRGKTIPFYDVKKKTPRGDKGSEQKAA